MAENDSNAPATKGDIQQLHVEIRQELQQEILQLRAETQHMYNDLVERISDSETKLLKAFYTFAETNQQRLTQVEATASAVITRLATLESRITDVEKRLNMPSQQ